MLQKIQSVIIYSILESYTDTNTFWSVFVCECVPIENKAEHLESPNLRLKGYNFESSKVVEMQFRHKNTWLSLHPQTPLKKPLGHWSLWRKAIK